MRGLGAAERGGTSAEAGLLLGAIFVVALPGFVVLGRYVNGSFEAACEGISRSRDPDCVTQQGTPPAIRPAPPAHPAEAPVAEWATRTRPDDVATDVACTPVPAPPPPGTSSDCVVTFDDGTSMRVVVAWVEESPDPVVQPVP